MPDRSRTNTERQPELASPADDGGHLGSFTRPGDVTQVPREADEGLGAQPPTDRDRSRSPFPEDRDRGDGGGFVAAFRRWWHRLGMGAGGGGAR